MTKDEFCNKGYIEFSMQENLLWGALSVGKLIEERVPPMLQTLHSYYEILEF